jgi:hypothetical protein
MEQSNRSEEIYLNVFLTSSKKRKLAVFLSHTKSSPTQKDRSLIKENIPSRFTSIILPSG